MTNSRQKGARGERELARILREYGYDCRRGQQYCGANGDADVVGLEGIHIECKRVERLNLEDAVAQSVRDSRAGELPGGLSPEEQLRLAGDDAVGGFHAAVPGL